MDHRDCFVAHKKMFAPRNDVELRSSSLRGGAKRRRSNLIFLGLLSLVFFINCAMARKPQDFPVTVIVDFGPAGKPRYDEEILVEKGTTPKEAVSQVFSVLSGKACCSLRDLIAIDGVKIDPAKNLWWICKLNGSRNVSPSRKKLKEGDRVEWIYVQED